MYFYLAAQSLNFLMWTSERRLGLKSSSFWRRTLAVLEGLPFVVCFLRVQTTVWWRSGRRITGVCWQHWEVMRQRFQTWLWIMRTPCWQPAAVIKWSECGACRPAPRWQYWRATLHPSRHYRCATHLHSRLNAQGYAWEIHHY